jgi:hypothetical protein
MHTSLRPIDAAEWANSTLQDVSIKHRVSYDRLRGLLRRYVRGEVDWSRFKHLGQIGLDEISLLKGHSDFVTIISARDEQARPLILAVLEGHKKERVIAFLQSIPERLRETDELYHSCIPYACHMVCRLT